MVTTKRSRKKEEEETRTLRKRGSVSYAYEDPSLDAILGTDNNGENIRSKKPDIASLRRKLERTCPATSLTNFVKDPADVISTLTATGFREPLVIRANASGHLGATRSALGIHLPLAYLSPRGLIKAVGGDHEVPTFDVATQDSGPRMTVKQLADYFALAPEQRTRLFNVVSFSLADTDLADKIDAPEATRQLDLAAQVWPDDDDPRPETLLYALLGPKGAYTDWHVDMGGSSVWYHLISGSKIFMLAPNTPKNIATFENWSTSDQQTSAFLGESLEGCQRVVLRAGDTLFLPSGWPHAVSTPEDSFVLGGNFLHSLDYESIAHVYRSEVRLGVQPKFQFPLFRRLMWHAARCAVDKIRHAKEEREKILKRSVGTTPSSSPSKKPPSSSAPPSSEKKKTKSSPSTSSPASKQHQQEQQQGKQRSKVKNTASGSPTSAPPPPKGKDTPKKLVKKPVTPTSKALDVSELNQWEQRGLPALLSLLQEWQKEPSAVRRVDVPDEIKDADAFLLEMEGLLILELKLPVKSDRPLSLPTSAKKVIKNPSPGAKRKRTADVALNHHHDSNEESKEKEVEGSDCGTISESDCSKDDGSSEEIDVKQQNGALNSAGDGNLISKDRRRPEKRTKQLASLVQLKEALAARASKPVTSPQKKLESSQQSPRKNGNGVTVITLSSSASESDVKKPIYISSSDSEDSAGAAAVRPKKQKLTLAGATTVPKQQGATLAGNSYSFPKPKSPLKGKKLPRQHQEDKKASEVYTAPVALDVQPLGRKRPLGDVPKAVNPLSRSLNNNNNNKYSGTERVAAVASTSTANGVIDLVSTSSERAVALKQIAEMRKFEQDLQREQRLLQTVTGGGVALKDSGRKLEERVSARKSQLERMKNVLEGKVLYYTDAHGQSNGPFTSRQLDVLVKAGSCPEGTLIEKKTDFGSSGGAGGSSTGTEKGCFLSIEEAVSLPIPLTAELLKEESDLQAKEIETKQHAPVSAAAAAGQTGAAAAIDDRGESKEGGFQKKKRSKNRSKPRKEYNEPYFSHNNNTNNTKKSNKDDFPASYQYHQHYQQQKQQAPDRPSAWEIAAATTATITQQEADPIWTFKLPQTGEYQGPYSTAELRMMFLSGQLVEDIMVHDEDGGVSTALFTLLGIPRNHNNSTGINSGVGGRYEIEPYRVTVVDRVVDEKKKEVGDWQKIQQQREPPLPEEERRKEIDSDRGNGGGVIDKLQNDSSDATKVEIRKADSIIDKNNNKNNSKEEKAEVEPYSVTMGRHFALSAPLPVPLPSVAYPPPASTLHSPSLVADAHHSHQQQQWQASRYDQPPQQQQLQQQQQQQQNPDSSYYRYPPPASQHAQQAPPYYQPQHYHNQHQTAPTTAPQQPQQPQQQYPYRPVPMTNAAVPRPMMRAVESGFASYSGGVNGGVAGEGGLGPMRPAAELSQYQQQQRPPQQQPLQQQQYYTSPPAPPSTTHAPGYWASRY